MSDKTCCTEPQGTPERANAPGRSELSTRVGTWASFREAMVASLATQLVPPDGDAATSPRPLASLTTRDADDPTMALIDAWAVACDVLAFYGERILEEGFLGTARQRDSVVQIARSLGYEPSPGVAASARLALTVQATPIDPESVVLDAGISVLSLPPDGEQPQTFETIEAVEAREEWNALAARQTQPWTTADGMSELWLQGVATRLLAGDLLVVAHPDRTDEDAVDISADWGAARVLEVVADPDNSRTWVRLNAALRFVPSAEGATPVILAFRHKAGIFGWNAPDYRAMNTELKAAFESPASPFIDALEVHSKKVTISNGGSPYELTLQVPWVTQTDWPDIALSNDSTLDLERDTDKAPAGSFVFVHSGTNAHFAGITASTTASRTEFTLVARVSRLELDDEGTLFDSGTPFKRRAAVVHHGSELLPPAEAPWTDVLRDAEVALAAKITAMDAGHTVLITGTAASGEDIGEEVVIEATIASTTTAADMNGEPYTVLTLDDPLSVDLFRDTVVVYGNTALATHGRTIASEVLGSGDATVENPTYTLRQAPLTWVAAATASGAEATLELRVNGVLWSRVDSLYDCGPNDRVYLLRSAEDGTTAVQMGDGLRGARVPTGADNITVSYRMGIGLDGEVGANQLTLLQSRPIGLTGVDNPGAASGAADPEDLEDARTNAPLKVLTLDRLVSLSDYEDFARAFAGIGKASARELWNGRRATVHLTVASASGLPFEGGAQTIDQLEAAIKAYGDPTHIVRVDSYLEASFGLVLRLAIDPDYEPEDVQDAVLTVLSEAFSFAERGFGQAVSASEVAALSHTVEGVLGVDVDALYRGATVEFNALLRAAVATWTGSADPGLAELLLLDPELVTFEELSP